MKFRPQWRNDDKSAVNSVKITTTHFWKTLSNLNFVQLCVFWAVHSCSNIMNPSIFVLLLHITTSWILFNTSSEALLPLGIFRKWKIFIKNSLLRSFSLNYSGCSYVEFSLNYSLSFVMKIKVFPAPYLFHVIADLSVFFLFIHL